MSEILPEVTAGPILLKFMAFMSASLKLLLTGASDELIFFCATRLKVIKYRIEIRNFFILKT